MSKARDRIRNELRDKEDRTDYAVEFGDSSIALQIKTLRLRRGWTQAELGDLADMHQSRISEMESVDYSSWSVTTLRRLATAFDLPLVVQFASWGEFLDDIMGMSREALERPSFEADPALRAAPDDSRSDSVSKPLKFKLPSTSSTLPSKAVGYG